jgi:uncharacterized protein
MKTITIALAALLVLAVAALAGVGRPEAAGSASAEPRSGITVTGVGHAEAVPDEAEFSVGITTKGDTARAALTANSGRMQELIAALKAAGIASKDLKTQDVSVGPSYEDRGGYVARNSVSVRIRELNRAGAVLDAASRAGATEVYGPSLTRSDREALEAQALADALANARSRAKALADAAGKPLGEVTAIVENGRPEPGPVYALAARAADAKAPIEPGTEEITATVTVTFAF